MSQITLHNTTADIKELTLSIYSEEPDLAILRI